MNTTSRFSQAQWRRHMSPGLVVTLFLMAACLNGAYARPDFRNLVFEAYPYPVDARTGLSGAAVSGTAENFLVFDNFIPASYTALDDDPGKELAIALRVQQETVDERMDVEGPYGVGVGDALAELAHLYQDAGEHGQALETFQHAIQISKINKGLFHEDQIPLVESSVQSLLALGDYSQVEEQLDFLVYLHQKYYGSESLELIRPLAAKVAWDMYFFEKNAMSRNTPAEGELAQAFSPADSEQYHAGGYLTQTQQDIIRGIKILVKANEFGNPFLHMFEQQLIETYFFQANLDRQNRVTESYITSLEGSFLARDPFDYTKANFINGEKAYQRLLQYLERSGQQDSEEYVIATLGLGDWYLLFNRRKQSSEQYALARAMLNQGAFSEQQKQALLTPSVPVELPEFTAEGSDSTPEGQYLGYVDVSFELTGDGRVAAYKTLAQSPGTHRYIASELEWQVRGAQFRPYLVNGEPADSGPLNVRYYYNY